MIYYWRVGILYYSDAVYEQPEERNGRPSSVFIPGKDIGEAWAALKATSILRDTDVVADMERWRRAEGGIEDERRLKVKCPVCHVPNQGQKGTSLLSITPIAGSTMLTGSPMPLTGPVRLEGRLRREQGSVDADSISMLLGSRWERLRQTPSTEGGWLGS